MSKVYLKKSMVLDNLIYLFPPIQSIKQMLLYCIVIIVYIFNGYVLNNHHNFGVFAAL